MRRSVGAPCARRAAPLLAAVGLLAFAAPAPGDGPGGNGVPGQEEARQRERARPLERARALASPDSLQVFLLSFGRGDRVWERFGHNALWIHDGPAGTDRVYNWGIFDFAEEDFLRRLLEGRMRYRLAAFSLRATLRQYRRVGRSVYLQQLRLTAGQRRKLQQRVRVNYRPDNRRYAYDPYRDNCSTRIRDHLDHVLDGGLRAAADSVGTGRTWRSHTLRLLRRDPLPYLGLALGMGRPADETVTAWQEMFLPLRMRHLIRSVRVPGRDGDPATLVSREDTLYLASRPPVPAGPPDPVPLFLAVSTALAAVLAWVGRLGGRGRRWARHAFGGLAALWCTLVGLAGTLMAAAWPLTDHWILHRNENLLQAHPLFLVLAVLLVLSARTDADPRRRRWTRLLARGLAALAVAGVLLQLLPAFGQANGPALALLVPLHLAVAAGAEQL